LLDENKKDPEIEESSAAAPGGWVFLNTRLSIQ